MAEPDYFWPIPCPKRYMREVNYVPAMLRKMRPGKIDRMG
jgi:hypothetical protein